MFDIIAIIFFWIPVGLLFYHWVLFPVVLYILAKIRHPEKEPPPFSELPFVTVAIAAWNEELHIAQKLQNSLELDYSADRIEILVGTDAITDRTNEIVREFAAKDKRIRLVAIEERVGKSTVINLLANEAKGEIILFTDADVLLKPDALLAGVERFRDPKVGLVLPAYQRINKEGLSAEGLWDRYENKLKEWEGKLGCAVGVYGWAMFLRRKAFQPLPADIINDDYVLGIFAFRKGYKSVYEPRSLSLAQVEPPKIEFQRKTRISRGNAQQFFRYSDILLPKYGVVAWVFFSHKYLRWFGPFFLLSVLIISPVKAQNPFFFTLFLLQAFFYLTTPFVTMAKGAWRKLLALQYFFWTNFALLAGYWQYFFGRRLKYNWLRTERRPD